MIYIIRTSCFFTSQRQRAMGPMSAHSPVEGLFKIARAAPGTMNIAVTHLARTLFEVKRNIICMWVLQSPLCKTQLPQLQSMARAECVCGDSVARFAATAISWEIVEIH